MLCDVIGQMGADHLWRRECFRVVADHERPLVLQSLWKPKDGFSRRFEMQLRASLEDQSLREEDTVTAGKPQGRGLRGGASGVGPPGRGLRGVARQSGYPAVIAS